MTPRWWAGRDLIGAGLLAALCLWTFLSGYTVGGDAASTTWVCIGCGVALLLGRFAGERAGPVAVLGLAVIVGMIGWMTSQGHTSPLNPLAYSNGSGAIFLQLLSAMLIVAGTRNSPSLGSVAMILALGIAALIIMSGSRAALLLLSLPASAALIPPRHSRRFALFAGILALLGLLSTVAVGATFDVRDRPDSQVRAVDALLTEIRPALWDDALTLMLAEPLVGVGPGRFAETSAVAMADPDTRWAHHGFLQQGAETGLPGAGLMIGVFAWAFLRLSMIRDGGASTTIAAAALAALAIHSCIDYIMHFPAVPITAAILVGAGLGGAQYVSQTMHGRTDHHQFAHP